MIHKHHPRTHLPQLLRRPATEIMEEPATEIMEEPATEIMEEPATEINKPVLSTTKMENRSRVSSLVGLVKKQVDSVNKVINKFADWIINLVPEQIRRTVNKGFENLKKKIKEIIENKKKLPPQEVITNKTEIKSAPNETGESSARQEVITNKTEIKLVENGDRVKVFKTTGNLNFDLTDIIMEKITPIIEDKNKSYSCFFVCDLSWAR